MFSAKTRTEGCEALGKENSEIVPKVLAEFDLPSCGLLVRFESQPGVLPENKLACYYPLATYMPQPDDLLLLTKLVEAREFAHLVLISQEACTDGVIPFTWRLAHECRHVIQAVCVPVLKDIDDHLRPILPHVASDQGWQAEQSDLPNELDADVVAGHVCRTIHGENKTGEYLDWEIENGTRPGTFKKVRECPDDFEVCKMAVDALSQYKAGLVRRNSAFAVWIDDWCDELRGVSLPHHRG